MPLTDEMANALQSGSPRGLFAKIEHPDGTAYFTTGVGTRRWNGHTWTGTGQLGSISPIKRTSEIAIQDITFSLSGIDLSVLNGLNDDVQNLNGSVWLYCTNYDGSVVRDPYQLVDSVLDFQTLTVGEDGTTTLSITAHSGFYTLAHPIDEAWSPKNQKLTYPDDTGLDMITSLQNQNLLWKAE